MAWKIPTGLVRKLNELHSEARFKHRHENGQDYVICILRDKHMKQDWCQATAEGSDGNAELLALEKCLAAAMPGDRPLTPVELAEENRKLKEELQLLEHPERQPRSDEELARIQYDAAQRKREAEAGDANFISGGKR